MSQNKKPMVAIKAPSKPVAAIAKDTVPVVANPVASVSQSISKAPSVDKQAVKATVTTTTPAKATTAKVKAVKVEKTPKLKMERDSFTMPKAEYAQINVLKERLVGLGQATKKSELLRAGIMQLTSMTDAALKAAMSKVPTIKTGRPKKK